MTPPFVQIVRQCLSPRFADRLAGDINDGNGCGYRRRAVIRAVRSFPSQLNISDERSSAGVDRVRPFGTASFDRDRFDRFKDDVDDGPRSRNDRRVIDGVRPNLRVHALGHEALRVCNNHVVMLGD
jgi:hypothetical protein